MSTTTGGSRLVTESGTSSLSGLWSAVRRRLTQGELGSLPIIIGLVCLWLVFQALNDKFLTPNNLTNLLWQMAAMGTVSVGIVLALLLGEIDLSAGAVSGLAAAVMAVLNVKGFTLGGIVVDPVPGPLAVVAGLLTGTLIGLLQGFWFTKVRVPAFIVTLAGFIGWGGALPYVLGSTGTLNLRDPFITGLSGTKVDATIVLMLAGAFVLVFAGGGFWRRRRAVRAGLAVGSPLMFALRTGTVTCLLLGAAAVVYMNQEANGFGLRSGVIVFFGLLIFFDLITRHTIFGQHIYATGGNLEAARRASIRVDRVRIVVFALCSTLAAAGGILAASRLLAVNQSSGGGDFLLMSIAAAVIGGTSLFGGRGNVWAALLGALVIQTISNGMDLLALPSSVKFMITGTVLLAAVTIDALGRRRREAAGG